MRDPYEVLELKKGAARDDVKRAYKKLAKQYHPDQYDNNPLRDLAEEKMRELNEAYDYLMKSIPENSYENRSNTNYSSNNNRSSYNNQNNNYNSNYNNNYNNSNNSNNNANYNNNYNSSVYGEVKMDINNGNLRAAEQKLHSVKTRDAEWNYLMGVLFQRKGWHDSARNYITTAYNMNPSHPDYRNAFNQLSRQNNSYRQNYYGGRSRDNDMCDLCVKLWCADSLCECMGGDLIDCM